MKRAVALSALLLAACASTPPHAAPVDVAALAEEVRAAETAFAKSMADRDAAAFASFLADDAIFVNGTKPTRGKAAIAADWSRFFVGPAPFTWRPETVVVLNPSSEARNPSRLPWRPVPSISRAMPRSNAQMAPMACPRAIRLERGAGTAVASSALVGEECTVGRPYRASSRVNPGAAGPSRSDR